MVLGSRPLRAHYLHFAYKDLCTLFSISNYKISYSHHQQGCGGKLGLEISISSYLPIILFTKFTQKSSPKKFQAIVNLRTINSIFLSLRLTLHLRFLSIHLFNNIRSSSKNHLYHDKYALGQITNSNQLKKIMNGRDSYKSIYVIKNHPFNPTSRSIVQR